MGIQSYFVLCFISKVPIRRIIRKYLTIGTYKNPFSSSRIMQRRTAAAMLAGFGNGLGSGINMTLGADFAPPTERGEFLGVWRLMGDSGSFAGPIFMGYIANLFALSTSFMVTSGMGLIGVLIMVFFVKETLVKRATDSTQSKSQ